MGHTPAETVKLGDTEYLRCRWVPGDAVWRTPETPRTVVQALRNGKAILEREGAWMTGTWFKNEHPEVNPDDPFCNNWQVCAEGAVGIATIGVIKSADPRNHAALQSWTFTDNVGFQKVDPAAMEMYKLAKNALRGAGNVMTGNNLSVAHAFNDGIFDTRAKVLDWFDKAISLAKSLEGDYTRDLVDKHDQRRRVLRQLEQVI